VRTRLALLLLALAVPVYFVALGANSIWDANEAFYVETPRQMLQSGDYVTPTFNGELRLNKPVLSYWIVAGLYHAFGVSVATERVGIALGAMGLILATWLIGRALGSSLTGALAALMFATAPRVVMHSRRIFIDVYLAMFLALALACFALAETEPRRRRLWLTVMYVAIGLGVLTKGPVAIALPAAAGVIWLAVEGRLRDLRRMMLVPGLLIVVAIAAPWYVALYRTHGWGPIAGFFLGENVGRFMSPMTPSGRDAAFFLPILFLDLFPWAPLLVVPIATAWRARRDPETPSHASIRRLLWVWIVAIVAAFSLSKTKEDLYIFPVMPAVAALVADTCVVSAFGRTSRALRTAIAVVGVLCGAVAVAAWRLFGGGYFGLTSAPVAAAIVGVSGVAAFVLILRGRGAAAIAVLAAAFIAFDYLFVARMLPDVERLKPVPALARAYRDRHAAADADTHVAHFRMSLPSMVYYFDRQIEEVGSMDHAESYFRDMHDERWLLLGAGDWEELERRARMPGSRVPPLCVAARHPILQATLDDLQHGTRPPDVVLVTTRCAG
jgi:4-amino-4-deoxy-L-arabinose transferase-like glycosyltransferase